MSGSNGKVVAITGGSRGIGRAIAELFRERGARVAICARSLPDKGTSDGFYAVRADVRRREDSLRFVKSVTKEFGSLDVFVNCAGLSAWSPIGQIDESFVEKVLETNLLGTLWGCAAAAAVLPKGGCIVNVSSLAGKRGSSNNSAYCAAKFAVNGVTQSLAKELGPRGIRVNAVCPVYVRTEQLASALQEPVSPAAGQEVQEYLSSFAATQTALGRLPEAGEVAEVVYFLASPAASAITGQCINVDCGVLPQ